MPVYPNYDYLKGGDSDEQLARERKRIDALFFRRLLFTRGLPITEPQREPEKKRTEQGDCGSYITS